MLFFLNPTIFFLKKKKKGSAENSENLSAQLCTLPGLTSWLLACLLQDFFGGGGGRLSPLRFWRAVFLYSIVLKYSQCPDED